MYLIVVVDSRLMSVNLRFNTSIFLGFFFSDYLPPKYLQFFPKMVAFLHGMGKENFPFLPPICLSKLLYLQYSMYNPSPTIDPVITTL